MQTTEFNLTEKTPLCEIAAFVKLDWVNMSYCAKPYIDAMLDLKNIEENYFEDSAKEIVLRALCNMSQYRGENARQIKKLLKKIAGIK